MPPRKHDKKVTFHPGITVSEPRFIKPREVVSLTKFNIFTPAKQPDVYIDEQLSHAIYDIEIANRRELRHPKKDDRDDEDKGLLDIIYGAK